MLFQHNNLRTSFLHALRGIALAIRRERNVQLHVVAALVVLALGCWLRISPSEWLFVAFAIAAVLIVELVNTVFERLIDLVKPRMHPVLHDVKDMMAGAVLLAAIAAFVVGCVVFAPKILALFPMGV